MWNWNYTNVNNKFFETITHELAYVIGFFLADGNISNYNVGGKYNVVFSNKTSDRDVLEKIANVCDYKNKVLDFKCGMSRIVFAGKFVWQFFTDLGFDNEKTFKSKIPQFILENEEIYNSFIRGIFDGDGSLSIRKRESYYPGVNVVGNKNTIDFIAKVLPFYNSKRPFKHSPKIYRIDYNGEKAVKFLNIIYNNSTIHMDRKYRLYNQSKNYRNIFKRWSKEEKDFLKQNYKTIYARDISKILNRSSQAISDCARKLGIKRVKTNGKL